MSDLNTILSSKPTNAFTSYSTVVFNNAGLTRCLLNDKSIDNTSTAYIGTAKTLVNGELKTLSGTKFSSLYRNASVNIDSNFGVNLLVPYDTGFLIYGSAGLAHEIIKLYIKNKNSDILKKLPKIKNIPPKMYRYGWDTLLIQYPNGTLIRVQSDELSKGITNQMFKNPYGGDSYQIKSIEMTPANTSIINSDPENDPEGLNCCIINEHTSITGTQGVLNRGPSCYNEMRSYYEWVINTILNSPENKDQTIEYSDIAYQLIHNTPGIVSRGGGSAQLKYQISDLDQAKVNIYNQLTYDDIYRMFDKQLDGDKNTSVDPEPLPYFITGIKTDRQRLLHFIPINNNSYVDHYNKEIEFDETSFDESFISPNSLSYLIAKNQETNALNAMSELFNNYLYDKINTVDEPDRYQWMFYDNALLLLEQDNKYWYINIIKYSDRYDRAQYRQIIRKDLIKNLIVSYSTNILTLKFSDINSATEKPTMVRMYDLNSDNPHSPIYSADESYNYRRSYSANNKIITDKFDIHSTYYSNGMLFRTESDSFYGNSQYNDYEDVPDIMLFTGERLNRISFNKGDKD